MTMISLAHLLISWFWVFRMLLRLKIPFLSDFIYCSLVVLICLLMNPNNPKALEFKRNSKLFLSRITVNLLSVASDFLMSNSFLLVSMLTRRYYTRASRSNLTFLFPATFGHFLVNYVITFNNSIYISTFSPFDFISWSILWTNKFERVIPSSSGAKWIMVSAEVLKIYLLSWGVSTLAIAEIV